ncbi:MAG: acyl-CoA dehydrogenase family protein [Pseudomonadota bacterium]
MHKTMDETLNRRLALRRADDGPAAAQSRRRAQGFAGHNAFSSDPVLTASLDGVLDEQTEDHLSALGAYWGSAEAQEVARIASDHPPSLRREDFDGRRIDQVEMHPAYHALMNRSVNAGLLSSAWEDGEGAVQHRLRAAALLLAAGCERGHLLPVSASHAAVASLVYASDLEAELFPLIASRHYDRRQVPLEEKEGAVITLAISERSLSGDYGDIQTRGELLAGDAVRITGEKTFVAAPGADLMLVLARTADGPTAALVPRYAPENLDAVALDAFADYGGLDAQAIATVTFSEARGRLVGEPGRGLQVLRDVRTLTQLDSAIIAAGGTRCAVARAVHHLRTRQSGGAPLLSEPLFARTMADLALASAAQTALAIRLAGAFDGAFERDGDHAIARVLTPAARVLAFDVAVSAASAARDAMAITALPRHHPVARVGPDLSALNHWDGAANDAALDLLGLVSRDETVLSEALEEIANDLGDQPGDLVGEVLALGREAMNEPGLARAFCERFAFLGAAASMRRNLPRVVSDAFISSRLGGRYTSGYGALDNRFDADAILDFIIPED